MVWLDKVFSEVVTEWVINGVSKGVCKGVSQGVCKGVYKGVCKGVSKGVSGNRVAIPIQRSPNRNMCRLGRGWRNMK